MTETTDTAKTTTMHAWEWATILADALQTDASVRPTFWRVEGIAGDSEPTKAFRCYINGYTYRTDLKPTVRLLINRGAGDYGPQMGVSTRNNNHGVLIYPDRFGILTGDNGWADRARAVREHLLPAVAPVIPEAERYGIPRARATIAAGLERIHAEAAPQEALADQLHILIEELDQRIARDDAVGREFRTSRPSSAAYAAHHEGRAEGYAYVVRRLRELLADDPAPYGVRLTDKGRTLVEATTRKASQ